MGILNDAGDKMLLGRQKKWPPGKYPLLLYRVLLGGVMLIEDQACIPVWLDL